MYTYSKDSFQTYPVASIDLVSKSITKDENVVRRIQFFH